MLKHLGDGIMAVFAGAADAIGAAVSAQRTLARHNRTHPEGEWLMMRVGVSAGDVTFESHDVFGTPVIEAARLCAAAEGGQILAAEVVRILAGSRGGHRFLSAGALELKGLPDPVQTVEVAWQAEAGLSVPLPVALLRLVPSRFVGREAELDRLSGEWKEVLDGERRVVLVGGEAGVGKTRLLAEAARAFHAEGAIVLFGRCEEELGVPYQPFAEALGDYLAACPVAELRTQLGPLGGELTRLAPRVAERVPGLPGPLQAEPETERYRLFEAVQELLTAISEDAPTLLVLDDLHWAPRPTLALLAHVIRRTDAARLFIVGTYRDTDLGETDPLTELLADLRRVSGTDRLTLSGLAELGVVALIEAMAAQPLDAEGLVAARAVWAETEGNPFFVGEVIRHLWESGAVGEKEGHWHVLRPVGELGIPEGVREVVGRRVSRLDETANQLLKAAAVIGREFDVALLAETAEMRAEDVVDALERAEQARLVVARPGGVGRYAFAHALVRSTLYDAIPTASRLRLHRRVGLALEGRASPQLTELARHFVEAAPLGEGERAVAYAREAGDRAQAGLAFEEAASHYERALGVLEVVDGDQRALRCELQIEFGDSLHRAGQRVYRDVLGAAADEARKLNDPRLLARVALARSFLGYVRPIGVVHEEVVALIEEALGAIGERDPGLRARLLAVLAAELTWTSDPTRRVALGREAVEVARTSGHPSTLMRVLTRFGFAVREPGDINESLFGARELVELAEAAGDVEAGFSGQLWLHDALVERCDLIAGTGALDAAGALAARLQHPVLGWQVAFRRAAHAVITGDFAEAEGLIAEADESGRRGGIPPFAVAEVCDVLRLWVAYERGRGTDLADRSPRWTETQPEIYQGPLALIFVEEGQASTGRRLYEELAEDRFASIPRHILWLGEMTILGRVAAALGDTARAEILYGELLPFSGRAAWNGLNAWGGPVDLCLGALARVLGRFEEAQEHLANIENLARRMSAPSWRARGQLEAARMLRDRGDPRDTERMRNLAQQALATAEALGMDALAQQARHVL